MIFEGEDKELLESIVNKGIQKMDYTAISDAMVQYALTTRETITLRTILRDYTGLVIFLAVILGAGLMTIIYLRSYANAMKKQRDQVEKANADRSEFFARMSHDMRTPMNGILGMIDLTKRSKEVDEMHDNMEKAQASGECMLSLINDTLDLQKLETKKLQLNTEVVYAKDYLESIFAMLNENAVRKGIDFRLNNINVNLKRYVEMDQIRVKQIFTNLLSNAIKFTPTGGTVEVVMECLGMENHILHHRYTIRDTGVGMTKEFIETKLYKPYAQENNSLTKELTGTGLGLAITKNLVDIMGGKISVESEPGVGTTFTLYLDFKYVPDDVAEAEQVKKKQKAKDLKSNLKGKRILVCEDHPLNAEIATKILQMAGCEVTLAENGKIGLDTFSNSELQFFDAILMDIRMPVMDGIETAKAIRGLEREDAKTIPIIAMTANAYDSDVQKSLDAGMNAHLAKPIDPMILFEELGKFC